MSGSFQDRADKDAVLGAVPEKIVEIAKAIETKHKNYKSHGTAALPKNFMKLSVMYRPLSRMSVTEKCNGCGLCQKLCPTNNITMKDGKAVRGRNCIACTACANWCPPYAIKSRMLKGQYRHPEVCGVEAEKLGKGKTEFSIWARKSISLVARPRLSTKMYSSRPPFRIKLLV